jgi:hypothetical protein
MRMNELVLGYEPRDSAIHTQQDSLSANQKKATSTCRSAWPCCTAQPCWILLIDGRKLQAEQMSVIT